MKELRGTPNSRTPPTSSLVGSFDLTEGDILAVFSQYGEIVDVNLVRNEETGKSRGLPSICYEDQRSTVLAVDNLNGAKVLGRDHQSRTCEDYRLQDEEAAKKKRLEVRLWGRGTLSWGQLPQMWRSTAHHSRSRRTTETILQESMLDLPRKDGDTMGFERTRRAPPRVNLRRGEGAAFKAVANVDDDDAMIRELKARKEAAMARARAAAQGLPIPGSSKDGAPGREAKRAKKREEVQEGEKGEKVQEGEAQLEQ